MKDAEFAVLAAPLKGGRGGGGEIEFRWGSLRERGRDAGCVLGHVRAGSGGEGSSGRSLVVEMRNWRGTSQVRDAITSL